MTVSLLLTVSPGKGWQNIVLRRAFLSQRFNPLAMVIAVNLKVRTSIVIFDSDHCNNYIR